MAWPIPSGGADGRIEPALIALRRLRMKQHFSLLRGEVDEMRLHTFARVLEVAPSVLADAIAAPFFGLGWSLLEEASAILERRQVAFLDLPREIEVAQRIHRSLLSEISFAPPSAYLPDMQSTEVLL